MAGVMQRHHMLQSNLCTAPATSLSCSLGSIYSFLVSLLGFFYGLSRGNMDHRMRKVVEVVVVVTAVTHLAYLPHGLKVLCLPLQ